MTENEALKLMKSLQISKDCELVKTLDFKGTVIKALEDLQQYRAIGTIEEFKALKEEVELYRNLDKTNFFDGYNKAIDEFANKCKEKVEKTKIARLELFEIFEIAEELKGGVCIES